MLNYILPPIIIIITAAILIMFLFRKAQHIPAQDLVYSENMELQPKKRMSVIFSALGQFGLKVLERIMHKLKLVALKSHNISNDWFHSIHEKRERRSRMQQEIIEKNKQRETKVEKDFFEMQQSKKIQVQPKQFSRPLIRENADISQQENLKQKNKFEDALIRRIAANPKDIEAYERLGDYYLENENFHDSLECFSQVLILSPINYKARLKMRRIEKIIK